MLEYLIAHLRGCRMSSDKLFAELNLAAANQPFAAWKPGQIIDWVRDVVVSLLDGADFDPDEVVAVVKQFYDATIRPIDIPYIPNMVVEPWVDEAIWKVIEASIRKALEK